MSRNYNVEDYWSRVGQEILRRGESYVAGDDNAYLRYKREKFLKDFLDSLNTRDRIVLEVGCGPGGNLKRLLERGACKSLLGVDISGEMLRLASRTLQTHADLVELRKINGTQLPYSDRSVDLSYTVTVLQHNTNERMVRDLISEICRVTRTEVVLMEDIGKDRQVGAEANWVGRSVDSYESLLSEQQFNLVDVQFLRTAVSRRWHDLVFNLLYRHVFNRRHKEGERIGTLVQSFIGIPLVITRYLDKYFRDTKNLAKMVFRR